MANQSMVVPLFPMQYIPVPTGSIGFGFINGSDSAATICEEKVNLNYPG
jgi:hypothetical protein